MNYPVYFISRMIFKMALLLLCRFEIAGRGNFPEVGPFIVASNHASFADPPVTGVACNTTPLTFMAKKELFEIPVFGLWFKAMGCIPVDRNSRSFGPLKQALQKLKEGKSIAIYPEGKRSTEGELQKAELGIGFLAFKSGAPVFPVYISGTGRVLPKGKKIIRMHKVKAKVGAAVDISDSARFGEKDKIYEYIGEKVMAAIVRLKNG